MSGSRLVSATLVLLAAWTWPHAARGATGTKGQALLLATEPTAEADPPASSTERQPPAREDGVMRLTLGVSGSHTTASVESQEPQRKTALSLRLQEQLASFQTREEVSFRMDFDASLGGGEGGVEGSLGLRFEMGPSFGFGGAHWGFVRIGGYGHLMGSDIFYQSRLQLPVVAAGYAHSGTGVDVDTGLRVAPILTGWHAALEGERALGKSFIGGAFLTLILDPFFVDVSAKRSMGGEATLDTLDGRLCGLMEGEPGVGLCANGRWDSGSVVLPQGEQAAAWSRYLGLSVVIAVSQ